MRWLKGFEDEDCQTAFSRSGKGNFRFPPFMCPEAALDAIAPMPQETFDQIIEKYVETNVVRPFREGNRRSSHI